MLVWEEDRKPAPSASNHGLSATHSSGLQQAVAAPTPPASAATASERRVNIADKRIINGQTDVNQLVPFKY